MAKPTAAFVCNNPINISVTGVSPTSRSHQDLVACIEVLTTEKLSLSADLSCAIKEISRMNAELTTALSMENESSAGAFEELQILLVKQSSIMERRLKNISDLAAAEEALKIFERSEAQPQIFATNLADITGTSLFFGHITVHFLVHLLSFTTYDPSQFLVDVCCLFLNGYNNNCILHAHCGFGMGAVFLVSRYYQFSPELYVLRIFSLFQTPSYNWHFKKAAKRLVKLTVWR